MSRSARGSFPKCPECKQTLVRINDFWGEPRFIHPDTPCEEIKLVAVGEPLTFSRKCPVCKDSFTSRVHRDYRRKTCSDECRWALAGRNLVKWHQGRTRKPKRQPREHLRTLWQKRAEEQDAKYAAIERKGTAKPRTGSEGVVERVAA